MNGLCALLLVFAAEPPSEILKTFRAEFVAIAPGKSFRPTDDIAEPFQIAKYETTQELWEEVMGNNPSRWKGRRNSVEMMTVDDAQRFCRQVTLRMRETKLIEPHQVVRLPSLRMWKYAAKAGTETKYSFGDDVSQLGEYAWFNGNAAGNDPPVGVKKPNPWGLYDMHGYLREFCSVEGVAQAGNEGRKLPKVVEWQLLAVEAAGGSWKDKAADLTSESSVSMASDSTDDAVGFRCVLLDLPQEFHSLPVAPIAQHEFVPPKTEFKQLWGEGEFTEGPARSPNRPAFDHTPLIAFTDIGNRIMRFDPFTSNTSVMREPSGRANGLAYDNEGRLFACEGANTGGGRRISVTEKDGTVRTLADRFEGKRFNSPNDLALDAFGNVYFTDPRYVGEEPRELDFEGVFRVTPKGEVVLATREAVKPNGIVFSPKGNFCYVSDHSPKGKGRRLLLRFKVKLDGSFADKTELFDFGEQRGIDGMTIDEQGNIFATAGTGAAAGVWEFDPEGKLLAWVKTPGDPTNCEWGGDALPGVLFVSTGLASGKYGLGTIEFFAKK